MKRDMSSLEEGKQTAWLAFPLDNPRIYDCLGREWKEVLYLSVSLQPDLISSLLKS